MKDEIIHANVAIKFNQVVNWVNFIQQGEKTRRNKYLVRTQ